MPSFQKKSINALFALILTVGYVMPAAKAQSGGAPIDIKADEQEFADDRMIARGKVVVVKGDTVVYAPVATLYKDAAGQPERAVFTGHPRLSQGQNKIHADTLTFQIKTSVIVADGHAHSEVISTSEEKEKDGEDGSQGKTKKTTRTIITDSNKQEYEQQTGRFEATGNVRVVTQDTVVNSDHMKLVYGTDRKAEAAVFTGKVKARQNKNLTEADTMTYFFNTQRLQANGHVRSRVVEEGSKDMSMMPETKQTVAQKPRIVGTAGGAIAASTKSGVYNTFSEQNEDKEPPIIIHSDSQDYNKETGRMDAVGNVKVVYKDTRGSGSHVVMVKNMDGETEKVVFLGRSQIIQPGRRWIGDRITLVMKDRKVIAEGNTRAYIIQKDSSSQSKLANFGPNLKNDIAPAPKQIKPIKNVTQFAEDEKEAGEDKLIPQANPYKAQGQANSSNSPLQTTTLLIEGLQKTYGGRRVVDGVSFTVSRGEVVGLLGRNGAGKTTSFDMVLGLVKPEKGSITLNGKDLSKMAIHNRSRMGVGYLPQENSTFRKLTVEENMMMILELRNIPKREQKEKSDYLLNQFGLGHLHDIAAVQLSGGERRRLEIARCLASEPHFILLDEPFTGIDPISISDIQSLIRRLRDEWNLGVLLTDHNPRATLRITDRAYLIDQGKILVAGSSQEVAESPVARKHYLGEDFTL